MGYKAFAKYNKISNLPSVRKAGSIILKCGQGKLFEPGTINPGIHIPVITGYIK